jgi:hypothetical protein
VRKQERRRGAREEETNKSEKITTKRRIKKTKTKELINIYIVHIIVRRTFGVVVEVGI